METQFVQGIVQKFFTLGEDQLVLMQRKTKDTKFVCRFGKGEHRSLVEGEDKKFDGMVKATDPYKEFDTYDFVGVQARGSDEVYVKSEKTSEGAEVRTEVTEKIPEVISKSDIVALEPYFNLMRMGMDVAIAAGLLQGVTDEMERDNIVSTCAFGILREAKKIKETFEKHNK